MKFNGKDMVVWSINDYLGVGSNEKIKQVETLKLRRNIALVHLWVPD